MGTKISIDELIMYVVVVQPLGYAAFLLYYALSACLKIDQLHVAYESLGNSSNYSTLSCWIVDTNVETSHEVDSILGREYVSLGLVMDKLTCVTSVQLLKETAF